MKGTLIIGLLLLSFTGCKKNVIKSHPDIFGTWHWINWCDSNNYNNKDLNIGSNAKGSYYIHNSLTGYEEVYSGKIKTYNDDVYIDGEFVFSIVEIVDTTGYLLNPNPPSFCSNDSIQVSGILRILNRNGESETYWKQ
jgi:hypothetical protein